MMLKVQPFQEALNVGMCGPASLKIVFAYYGIERSEEEMAKLSGWKEGLGVDGDGLRIAAEGLGFNVRVKDYSSFQDIEYWLKANVPVIVDWFSRGRSDYPDSETADGHYSVVAGLDSEFIHLQDPEIGKIRKIKRPDFMRVWFDFRGNTAVPEELIVRQLIAVYK